MPDRQEPDISGEPYDTQQTDSGPTVNDSAYEAGVYDDEIVVPKRVPLDMGPEDRQKYNIDHVKKSAISMGVIGTIIFLPECLYLANILSGRIYVIKPYYPFVAFLCVLTVLTGTLLIGAAGLYFLKNWARMLLVFVSWVIFIIGILFLLALLIAMIIGSHSIR